MKAYLAGEWRDGDARIEVRRPFDGSVVDTVPAATARDVDRAVTSLVEGAAAMRATPARERSDMLRRAAAAIHDRAGELGRLITEESGKILAEGLFEAGRAAETLDLSAAEARRIGGEVLPLDAAPGVDGQFGFTLRVPCGVVAAITPFNFPLNLVCHKVGPALAAGNAVIVKPASATPLSALKLVEILLEAGCPSEAIACLPGSGREIGRALCRDGRIRKVSFTGSVPVGETICREAGLKRVTTELGSNSPIIVMEDADLDRVAAAVVATGYSNAGQVCISAQRLIVDAKVHDELLHDLTGRVADLTVGDPLAPDTHVGPLIEETEARRVRDWIAEAAAEGATVLCGGDGDGSVVRPAILAGVKPDMRVSRDELFGPAVAACRTTDFREALRVANDSRYGLSAAIFTRDIDRALAFAREVDSGNLHINWGPGWRADLMPYGGLKQSGIGKEGPTYAVEEMSEVKTVVIHPSGT